MKNVILALILFISCSSISFEESSTQLTKSEIVKQDETYQKLTVSDSVVYSQVLTSIVYWGNPAESKAPFEQTKGDWLTIKKETVALDNSDEVKQFPHLSNELVNDFIEQNRSKENLRSDIDVKYAHDVVEQKGSLESFFITQKMKNSRLQAVIGFSKIGFSKDKSKSLIYVEYYNPQFGLQKKYCLITWKKDGQGLMDESVNWF